MRTSFRHGIVSTQTSGFLQYTSSGHVSLLANNKPVTVTIADKNTNYLYSQTSSVENAWEGPFTIGKDYWLYIDFDTLTFQPTFGYTDVEPIIQTYPPESPVMGANWFNTNTNIQYAYVGNSFSRVYRVFIAKLNSGNFVSVSQKTPSFLGTQIGNNNAVSAGEILFDESGLPLTRDDKTFFTTDSQFFTLGNQLVGVKLDNSIFRAKCDASAIAKFQIVALTQDGKMRPAQYADISDSVIAILNEDVLLNEVASVTIDGRVVNPLWDFSALKVGTPLWVDNSELVTYDPHVTAQAANPVPMVPIAKVMSRDSIIFKQGLGGVGPKGPEGSVDNLPPAKTTELGAVFLTTAPVSAATPKVVSDNDPRLVGAPFAAQTHNHAASDISVQSAGSLTANTVQEALDELDDAKLSVNGGTLLGSVILTQPTQLNDTLTITSGGMNVTGTATFLNTVNLTNDPESPLGAATKRYVDDRTSGLKWTDPVCLANLIGDDVSNPSALTPNEGDAYIVFGNGTGDWASFSDKEVVRWNSSDNVWESGGILNVQNFAELRFLLAGTSSTPTSGSFSGREREIVIYNPDASIAGYEVPVNSTAVFVCNSFSGVAFNQYVYNAENDKWTQTSGSQKSITPDNLTIKQIGNTISTITFANGGLIDATTYRGVDAATLFAGINHDHDADYSQLGHIHDAADVTFSATGDISGFGSPKDATTDDISATNVEAAILESFGKKANKSPYYETIGDLPAAVSAPAMVAGLNDDKTARISMDGQWKGIALNDGTVQDHLHRISYDVSFYSAGPVASIANQILGRFVAPRELDIPPNSNVFARVINPPQNSVDFQIYINGVVTSIIVTFAPNINGGLFVNGTTGAGNFSISPGDYIDLVSPNDTDSTLSDISLTIVGEADTGLV